MSPFLAEFLGTAILVLLGNGVVANVLLNQTKGQNAGWIVITAGWAFAVTIAVYCVGAFSGAHLNPAVTIGLASIGQFSPSQVAGYVAGYVAAQIAGGVVGAILVWLSYLPHWRETSDQSAKLGVFCTAPAIRSTGANFLCEVIGTAMLVFALRAAFAPENFVANSDLTKGFKPCLVGIIVWAIGLSLGGPTGYAINPARDLGPRIAHAILPIPGKGGSDWGYAWIPVAGPILGGVLGAWLHHAITS